MIHLINGQPPDLLPIEKGLPIPPSQAIGVVRTSSVMQTARSMIIGDSIIVPYTRSPIAANMTRATGFKFSQRKIGKEMRIWRIE